MHLKCSDLFSGMMFLLILLKKGIINQKIIAMIITGILFVLTATGVSIYCIRQPAMAKKARRTKRLENVKCEM